MNLQQTSTPLTHEQKLQEKTDILNLIAQEMRKQGASESTIQEALISSHELLKLPRNSLHKPSLDQSTTQTSAQYDESAGILLSNIEKEHLDWLWEKRIPLGKITLLQGDPGMGKSLLAIHLAACISTGKPMPGNTTAREGGVIIIAPEDAPGDTIRPRIEAAGGDPSQILLLNNVESLDLKKIKVFDRPFSLSQDLETLEAAINQVNATLVILDPLMAVLGSNANSARDQDVREVLTPLARLAERTRCAILIINHLNRSRSENPLYRSAGSIGIIAAARIGLLVTQDPVDTNSYVLASIKNNLSKKNGNLTYQIRENEHNIPYIQWLGENHYHISTLLGASANISAQRQSILKLLQETSIPLSPQDIATRIGHDYERVRKMLPRMLKDQEIISPSRGLYTANASYAPAVPTTEQTNVPTETSVPNATNVPNLQL